MTKELGEKGENIACRFLKKKGIKILEKNYKAIRGEIDIIGMDKECLVFVEVKAGGHYDGLPPEIRVNSAKQRQIGKIAQAYLQETKTYDTDCRFDVVSVIFSDSKNYTVKHFENAF